MTTIQPPPPPPPPIPLPAPPAQTIPADIVTLPPNLETIIKAVTMKGEVTAQTPQGQVTIATPRGLVEIQLPPNLPAITAQNLEIIIEAGTPPLKALVSVPRNTQNINLQTVQDALEPTPPAIINSITKANITTPPALESPVTPTKLLETLKTSLENILKPLGLDNKIEKPQQQPQILIQKPLVVGQLVRITPVLTENIQTIITPATTQQNIPLNQSNNTLNLKTPPTTTTITTPVDFELTPTILKNTFVLTEIQPPKTANQNATQNTTSLKPLAATIALQTISIQSSITTTDVKPTLPITTDVRVASILPSTSLESITRVSTPASSIVHSTPATPVLFATVKGQTPQGLPVIEITTLTQAPDGTIKSIPAPMVLQFPASNLSVNSILKLEILPQIQSINSASTLANLPWAALDDMLNIPTDDPLIKTSLQALQTAIPKPGATNFAAPVLMLVAALRSGEIAQWISEKTADILRNAKRGDSIEKLKTDFTNISREQTETPKGEWRSLSIPMLYGQELTRIELSYKGFEQGDPENENSRKSGTRFIVDLALNRMGQMQIDGYAIDNKLDITLKSEHTLSAQMREIMRARYTNALANIGFTGQLNFNASRQGWIVLNEPIKVHTETNI